ncbi:MAG: PAS domain S-box protein [Halobacteriota archaeon]|nr:PAS domain S-box protein [Halobacteriota archaeon]
MSYEGHHGETEEYNNIIKKAIQKFIDFVSDYVLILDEKGRILSLNKSFEKITGYPNDMFIGKSLVKLIAKEDLDEALNLFPKVMKGETAKGEIGFLRKDGEVRRASFIGRPMYSEGKTIGILGVGRDITELKKVKKMLEDTKLFTKEIIDVVSNGLIMTDLEGNITSVNKYLLDKYEYDEEEFIDKSALKIFPLKSQDIERFRSIMTDVITEGKAGPIDMEVVAKNGRKLSFRFDTTLLKDVQGNPVSILIVATEI